jgi:predicted CopG family antitoxin|tara:strand:+ start:270 stop:506 length:237 start_codon:yes stop_codon:yes gene_type:complete
MITTLQISDRVKDQLRSLKEESETFEDVIISLLNEKEKLKEQNKELIKKEANHLNQLNKELTNQLQETEDIGSEIVEW